MRVKTYLTVFTDVTVMCYLYVCAPSMRRFAQCCNGDVVDNRTEKCCMGMERATVGQACCGHEAYDLHSGDECCGSRYLYDKAYDTCCHDFVVPLENILCCDKGPIRVEAGMPAGSAACCGCGTINAETHTCCGGQAVPIDSASEACCAGETIYDPSKSVCCPEKGKLRVIEGQSCAKTNGNLSRIGGRVLSKLGGGPPPMPAP